MANEQKPEYALFLLRISVARVAQAAGIETEKLPVLGKSYGELAALARNESAGWNTLAGRLAEQFIESKKELTALELDIFSDIPVDDDEPVSVFLKTTVTGLKVKGF